MKNTDVTCESQASMADSEESIFMALVEAHERIESRLCEAVFFDPQYFVLVDL